MFGSDHFFQTLNIGFVVCNETAFPVCKVLVVLGYLLLVESCQLLQSGFVAVVAILHLDSELLFLSKDITKLGLVFLAPSFDLTVQILYFCAFLLQLVVESLHFGFMQVSEFFFILFVGSDQVVLSVLILSANQLKLMGLLTLDLLDFCVQESDVATELLIFEF